MGESADTAREKLAAKRKRPRPLPKPTPAARSYGAHTAIFVPPALQKEGAKPPPTSVLLKPKPESIADKRAREQRETRARERMRLGLKISTSTGANLLSAVPPAPPDRHLHLLGGLLTLPSWERDIPVGIAKTAAKAATAAGGAAENWISDIKKIPERTASALLYGDRSANRLSPVPARVQQAGAVAGTAEPLVRPLGKTAAFLATEKGQEDLWGKSLVNLVLHGDVPKTKGEAAGLGLGALAVLPLGRLGMIARLGRVLKVTGKAGEALDGPARDAARAAFAQRVGEEQADNVMAVTDNMARQLHPENPMAFYEKTDVSAPNFSEFTPSGQEVRFQTEPGARQGLVEGFAPPARGESEYIGRRAAFKKANSGEDVHFETGTGELATLRKTGQGQFEIVSREEGGGSRAVSLDEARAALDHGKHWHTWTPGASLAPMEQPVFYSELRRQVAKLPADGYTRAQTEATLRKAVKPAERRDAGVAVEDVDKQSGFEDFLDQYFQNEKIPRADIEKHLASSLNAYDLDEMLLSSNAEHFWKDRYGTRKWFGLLTVRDSTREEPYYELVMRLRTPMYERVTRGVMGGGKRIKAPYSGVGTTHWNDQDVVGHVRFHIITDAEGKKALLVDEIQSDWASQWRKFQKRGGRAAAEEELRVLKERMRKIESILNRESDEPLSFSERLDTADELETLRDKVADLEHELTTLPGPPPLGSRQMEAIVRRTMRFAHDANVDRIIIVRGDVQSVRNIAFRKTPKGRDFNIHVEGGVDGGAMQQQEIWEQDTMGMTQDEVRAYANDPIHQESGMAKTFAQLYGSREKKGDLPAMFEKEMGEQGALREGIFEGGYTDMTGSITRKPENSVRFEGEIWRPDPNAAPAKEGDVVLTSAGAGRVTRADTEVGTKGYRQGLAQIENKSYIPVDLDSAPVLRQLPRSELKTTMMDGYVIEMTPAARAKAAVPMALYQQRAWEQIPKGATEFFADGTRAVHLFEDADISTILHELSHVALADVSDVDRAILNRHFNNFATTADHEMYARSFERYIYEGQAMASELDGVFAKLKTWMAAVYQHVNSIGAVVHPEVKQVFDRMTVKAETPGEQLVRLLKTVPGLRKEQEAVYSEERARRIGNALDAWKANQGGEEGFYSALTELQGELPKIGFSDLNELTPEAVDSLLKTIVESPRVRGYEKVRAADAILAAKNEGYLPTRSELLLLNKIFGGPVGFRNVRRGRLDRWFTEIWNLPRSVSASYDLSAPLRQTLVAATRHPVLVARATRPMFKTVLPGKKAAQVAEDVAEDLALRPNAKLYGRAKLATGTHPGAEGEGLARLSQTEEPFASELASKIPGVKHSERAYETFLHKVRADIFDHMIDVARAKDIDVESDRFLQGLGRYVNGITGRGTLSRHHLLPLEQSSDFWNLMLFSPRLLASRVNMISPVYYGKLYQASPFLFWQQVRATGHTVGTALTVLAVASMMPGVSVGLDPTSANFGKIRVGDTRVDILAGFNPLMVLIARLAMSKSTSSTTGKTQNLEGGFGKSSRYDILQRFMEGKMAPSPSILRDFLKSQTYLGQPVKWDQELLNATTPMALRDAYNVGSEPKDPMEQYMAGLTAYILGGLGVGFTSYPNKASKSSGPGGPLPVPGESSGGLAPMPGSSSSGGLAPMPP